MASRWVQQLTFRAIDPHNLGKHWKVGVPPWLFEIHQKYGHDKELGRLVLVKEVLENDESKIYEGWRRPGKEGCYVYGGRPNRDFKKLTIETPAPPNMDFMVFVLPDGSIDHWRWQLSDDDSVSDEVKGRLIWPPN